MLPLRSPQASTTLSKWTDPQPAGHVLMLVEAFAAQRMGLIGTLVLRYAAPPKWPLDIVATALLARVYSLEVIAVGTVLSFVAEYAIGLGLRAVGGVSDSLFCSNFAA